MFEKLKYFAFQNIDCLNIQLNLNTTLVFYANTVYQNTPLRLTLESKVNDAQSIVKNSHY